ncbi:MAG: ATP-binding protein, partial [Prevotellaceae bacterium]|nr:ATP-binding protein [Prevotellaceae bacterium]
MKKLPIGIQSFSDLRSNDCLYVDKTESIYEMVSSGHIYFLSRPRRFGKSLLVSTLEALFKGRKDLFEGLYIYDKWDWTKQYPVVRLDWNTLSYSNPETLENALLDFVKTVALENNIVLRSPYLPSRFYELLERLHRATGRRVVFLVDEYAKPAIDSFANTDMMTACGHILNEFYRVLKAADEHLNFIFLTGVSKFVGVSAYMGLNSFNDITLSWKSVAMCGYTQEELESYFTEYIDKVSRDNNMSRSELLENIGKWYNGYSWDGETSLYSPYSILSFFDSGKFDNYWFRPENPTFLIDRLKSRNNIAAALVPVITSYYAFDGYNPGQTGEIALLLQTGYLTVKNKESASDYDLLYTLDVPNEEVRKPFLEHLLNAYSNYPIKDMQVLISDMQKQICAGDASGLEKNLRMLLANIPYKLFKNEAYYHSLFLLLMKMLGFDIQEKELTGIGRIDAVWTQPGLTVVAELKYGARKIVNCLRNQAMKQIHDRRYYEAYLDRKVMLMAIA